MQKQTDNSESSKFVFRPNDDEKRGLITNQYLLNMPRDENLRYELIGGEIVVSTAPRYIHQLLVTRIMSVFLDHLKEDPSGEILATPGLIFSEFDGVIPDLVYISHEKIKEILNQETGKLHGSPEIIIEILSPGRTNARRDLQVKRELFEIYKVPEYWVMNPHEKELTVFRFEGDSLKEKGVFHTSDKLTTDLLPNFELDLAELFRD